MKRLQNILVGVAAIALILFAVHHCSTHEPPLLYPYGADFYPDGSVVPRPKPTQPWK